MGAASVTSLVSVTAPSSIATQRSATFTARFCCAGGVQVNSYTWALHSSSTSSILFHPDDCPRHRSSDLHGVHQSSFDISQGSLPPAEAGSGNYEPFTPPQGFATPTSTSSHLVTSSRPSITMHLDTVVAASGFSAKQIKGIYNLAQEGQRLGSKIAKDFANLSCQEALFCIAAQSTSYEKVASGHPDCYTVYYAIMHTEGENNTEHEEAIEYLCKKEGQAWLDTDSTLFWHILEFEAKLAEFLTEAEALLQVRWNHIWMVMHQTTEDAVHLWATVWWLPSASTICSLLCWPISLSMPLCPCLPATCQRSMPASHGWHSTASTLCTLHYLIVTTWP